MEHSVFLQKKPEQVPVSEGQELKTAPSAEEAGLTVKEANGSYGEFLRVDLTGNYGDLGAICRV